MLRKKKLLSRFILEKKDWLKTSKQLPIITSLEDGLQKSITLEQDQIFTSQVSERFKETSFTLPGVIDGASP